ncbi:MAG TPA: pyridoxal-phosphate dependent enzyme [Nocardioidaceae bacterium]|nr:pyridoxal-phosphate dependent enzyme [Nocardioidaceae bacterium]
MPLLHDRFPELRDTLPHVTLGQSPSPLRRIEGLTNAELWVKDEGAFGDGGWGGNKVRKLEWLIPDAQRRGRRTILTFGGLGTNWGLATALYGKEHGLSIGLALVDQPVDDHVRAQLGRLRTSGARLHFTHSKARTIALLPLLLAQHRDGVKPPYLLPAGGSSAVGVLGPVEVALELADAVQRGDLQEPSHVVTAVGTGGTAGGLALGLALAGLRTKVVAVVVNDKLKLDEPTISSRARRTQKLLRARGARLPTVDLTGRLLVVRDQLGAGYGHSTPEGSRATEAAGAAGLHLDPVYTAKAAAELLAMDERGELEGPVVFLQTDGPR